MICSYKGWRTCQPGESPFSWCTLERILSITQDVVQGIWLCLWNTWKYDATLSYNVLVPLQCCAVLCSVRKHQAQVNLAGLSPAGSNISPSMQHASICNKHISMKQLQVLSSLKCKSCTPRNVPFKGKYTFDFVKQNVLFILFSGIQFHLFYLNSENC